MVARLTRWLLRHYKWLLPVAALCVSIAVPWIKHWSETGSPARLRVTEVFAVNLLSPLKGLGLPLRVTWVDQMGVEERAAPLTSLNIVKLALSNTGDVPLNWRDTVRQPVTVIAPRGARILSVFGTDRVEGGPSLRVSRVSGSGEATVETEFLNPGEVVSLLLYHDSDSDAHVTISGRLYDHPPLTIERPAPATKRQSPLQFIAVYYGIGLTVGIVGSFALECLIRIRKRSRPQAVERPATAAPEAQDAGEPPASAATGS